VGSVALGLVVVAAAGGVAVLGAARSRNGAAEAAARSPRTPQTAAVTKKDLAETKDVNGSLGYGSAIDLSLGGRGVITGLPAVGSVVDRGGQLGEVDSQRVTLLLGDRPMWRDLQEGMTDGADVAQLETNLIALGYGTKSALGPNQTWTSATTAAVKRWQKATGQAETGAVRLGQVVFLPKAVRVAARVAEIGAGSAGPALKTTGTSRQVVVDLIAKYQSLVKTGQHVQVELPDSTKTPGTITSVGTVATSGGQGQSPTIPVVVSLDDQAAGTGLDQAPVTVHLVTQQATGVLAVPVGALLALTEGGYAIERVTGPGGTSLVAVTLGSFADGWVQVKGEVREGDRVVVAQ
jgi:hypothetical protein